MSLIEGRDFYMENGLCVLTADYLVRRGYCCDNGCRHCPYSKKPVQAARSAGRPRVR